MGFPRDGVPGSRPDLVRVVSRFQGRVLFEVGGRGGLCVGVRIGACWPRKWIASKSGENTQRLQRRSRREHQNKQGRT